ncbi:unnamed protein product, partial [marine sediment metagenome]
DHDIIRNDEVEKFCEIFFKLAREHILDHPELNSIIDEAVKRCKDKEKDEQKLFKRKCSRFVKRYTHFAQVMLFQDESLEKMYIYCRYLLRKLSRNHDDIPGRDDIELLYYKAIKDEEHFGKPNMEGNGSIHGTNDGGSTKRGEVIMLRLTKILQAITKKSGLPTSNADKIFLEQIERDCIDNQKLKKQAINKKEQFRYGFKEQLENIMIERMGQNQAIYETITSDEDIMNLLTEMYLNRTYRKLRENIKEKRKDKTNKDGLQ